MNPEHLKTKREFDVYIQALKDVYEEFKESIESKIELYEDFKEFIDEDDAE